MTWLYSVTMNMSKNSKSLSAYNISIHEDDKASLSPRNSRQVGIDFWALYGSVSSLDEAVKEVMEEVTSPFTLVECVYPHVVFDEIGVYDDEHSIEAFDFDAKLPHALRGNWVKYRVLAKRYPGGSIFYPKEEAWIENKNPEWEVRYGDDAFSNT